MVATIVDPSTLMTSQIVSPGHDIGVAVHPDSAMVHLDAGG